jgi:glycerophosphoryl diester phosphodiesterase
VSVWSNLRRPPLVVGHRGGRGVGWPPENTIAAFEQARREGAAAVELDVRTCAGEEVVVYHDPTLSRATQGTDERRVADLSLGELRAIGVETLDQTFSWARTHRVAVNVEMKHDVPNRAALARATVLAIRTAGVDALLSSFDPLLLALAAVLAPRLPRALLVHAKQPLWAALLQQAARPPFVGWLNLERIQARPRALGRHLRRGLRLGVWTVNDPHEAVDLARLGVSSIITDTPGAIVRALAPQSAVR